MNVVIQIAEQDDARAWGLLQRHSPGIALPNRTFVVSEAVIVALRQAGIAFDILSNTPIAPREEGVVTGERI
jgi:hypothetical protein